MKYFNICLLVVIFALICSLSLTHADDGGDGSIPAAKRIALRRPSPIVGKAGAKTTTTTTPAPASRETDDGGDYNDDENGNDGEHHQQQYDGGEEGDDAAGPSSTTTTTEAPKKIGPVIRPFRSNDDFLNSLKRRQQNAKKHRSEKVTVKPNKKTDDTSDAQDADSAAAAAPAPAQSAAAAAPTPAKGFKSNSALNRRKLTKSNANKPTEAPIEDAAAEESEQQQKEETKPKRPIGRLALRKRN